MLAINTQHVRDAFPGELLSATGGKEEFKLIGRVRGGDQNLQDSFLYIFLKIGDSCSWGGFIPPSDLLPLIFSPLLMSFGIAQPFLPVSLP